MNGINIYPAAFMKGIEFSPDLFMEALPVIGWGMLGIFVVIGIIYASVAILQLVFKTKKEDNE